MVKFEVGKTYMQYVSSTDQRAFLCTKRTDSQVTFQSIPDGICFRKKLSFTYGQEAVHGVVKNLTRPICLVAGQLY